MKPVWLLVGSGACAMAACAPVTEPRPPAAAQVHAVGADRDAHGCVGSAGYTWSVVRQACIRVFEAGLAFQPEPGKSPAQGAVLQAFVVLAPAQGGTVTAAEAFVPGLASPMALSAVRRADQAGRRRLLVNAEQGLEVFQDQNDFILEVRGQRFRRPAQAGDRLFLVP